MDSADKITLPTYYTILPACIRFNANIPQGAKLLRSDISVLSLKRGYCFSTNDYFARIHQVKTRTICDWIHVLKEERYIKIKHFPSGVDNRVIRHIYTNTEHPLLAEFFAAKAKKCLWHTRKIRNQ